MQTFTSRLIFIVFCAFLLLGWNLLSAQNTKPDDLSLGSIDFPTSASGEAQQEFLTGVLALHSFWYPEARDHFRQAQELDPTFAMAYWGEAMTYDHPIWEQHDQKAGIKTLNRLDKQLEQGNLNWSDREKAYIDAIRILYDSKSGMNHRRQQYAKAMQQLSNQYPDDDEALAFAALAAMSAPDFNYSNPDVNDVIPIAAKLEDLYQRKPDHPGAIHYLIHVYDSEKFARMGLRPARDYADIAYSSSHAIHMPSHIYKHLEMWDKVIASNIRAYDASVEWQKESARPVNVRDFHSYRWLFEAYLEINEYQKACNMIKGVRNMLAAAKTKDEVTDRIQSSLENLEGQYAATGEHAPQCKN